MHKEVLKDLPGWKLDEGRISKQFGFASFPEGIKFINDLVPYLQKINHHPDIQILYNKVLFELTSHDLGDKVTELDIQVAKEIEVRFERK